MFWGRSEEITQKSFIYSGTWKDAFYIFTYWTWVSFLFQVLNVELKEERIFLCDGEFHASTWLGHGAQFGQTPV